MQNSLQNNIVSVVTLCDIFILDLNDFWPMFSYKIDFSLKISYLPFFACFCSFISQKHVAYSQKKYGISYFHFFKEYYEKLIF